MRKITRRRFLKLGAGSSLALGIPGLLTGCKKGSLKPSINLITDARVAAVRGNDLYDMTIQVLEALGGIQSIVHERETVFIKPNMVTLPWAQTNDCFNNGECTKPEIVIAVAEECLRAGASEVIIGDGSQTISFNWQYAATLDGETNLVAEATRLNSQYNGNVTLVCLEDDSPDWIEIPSRTSMNNILISGLVTNADRVISIPVAKTHSWAQLTLALKNFIGITSIERYGVWLNTHWDRGRGLDHSSPRSIAQIYLDIVDALRPDLTIIDFSIGIEGNGPTTGNGGTTVNMSDRLGSWLILASTDIVAADATAARIMNHNVSNIDQLTMGHLMGLGAINEESITIIGENLNDLKVNWSPANLMNSISNQKTSTKKSCDFAYSPIYRMNH